MANPPKKKGTAGEAEVKRLLEDLTARRFRRTQPGCAWDLEALGKEGGEVIHILATRPDRGRWLLTMRPVDWGIDPTDDINDVLVEVKRYKRFSLHRIFEETFGD